MVISLSIPEKGICLVKSGQKITFSTPLYEEHVKEEHRAYIAAKLHISPSSIFKYLKKFVGDEVQKGEIIAEKKSMFSKLHYASEVEGLIREISHTDGAVIISVDSEDDIVHLSPLVGEVEQVSKKEIQVKVIKAKEYTTKEIQGTAGGRLFLMKNEHEFISEDEVRDAIICTSALSSYNQIKFETLGALGFIVQRSLPDITNTPFAIIKTIQEFEMLQKSASPSCFFNEQSGTMMCYG